MLMFSARVACKTSSLIHTGTQPYFPFPSLVQILLYLEPRQPHFYIDNDWGENLLI